VARDRKRAKQRRERGAAVARRADASGRSNGSAQATSAAKGPPENAPELVDAPVPHGIERTDVPGALEHASADVEEFDAALVRGAAGLPVSDDTDAEDALQEPQGPSGPGDITGGGGGGRGEGERPSGAPLRGGNRAIGFLRASWAELQRVQWPDRRQVTQATAVVLGFVTIAGLYLGAADYVAKEIVEFIL
jgi:preprotein translocase subunit SecE